ncbi:MAG TPA: hypothetical protein VLK36_15455 [Gaiellaceae bacterium]|nr:hypothetical protein [Gaiellaceae bacterium]
MQGSKRYDGRLGWAVAALVGAMAADLAETLVDPANSGNATTIYDAALRSHGAMALSAGLLLLSSVLIVPGVIGVVRSLGGRALWFGRAAQAFALLGAIGHGALAGVYLMWASIPGGEASRAQLISVIERMNNSPSLVMIFPLFIAFPVALLTTYGAAVRARRAPRWVLGAAAAALVLVVAHPVSDRFSTSAALVCLIAAALTLVARPRGARHIGAWHRLSYR